VGATGLWSGQIILGVEYILALAGDGPFVVVEAAPEAHKEVARFKALASMCWSRPALRIGRIYIRNAPCLGQRRGRLAGAAERMLARTSRLTPLKVGIM
jgi:hypothetical protein